MNKKKAKQIKKYSAVGVSFALIGVFIVLAILEEKGIIDLV
ncbi:MAG: hypothetical protein Q4B55_07285 [Lachnospiraceae bacterium]|nr:hypothetical protein [Lachnospiraceae bacterium]